MPLSVFWGLYFALLAFCSIWCISPCIKGFIIWVSQKPSWDQSGSGPEPVRYRSETKPDPKLKFFLDNFHQQDLGINGQNVLGSIVWIIRLNFHKDSSDAENAVSTTSKHPLRNIHFEIFTSKHSIRNILFPTRNEYLKILFRVNNFGILVAVKHFKQF